MTMKPSSKGPQDARTMPNPAHQCCTGRKGQQEDRTILSPIKTRLVQ